MIIRAMVKNGLLQPLEPLPADWAEGRTLEIDGYLEPVDDERELEEWYRDMAELTAELDDPEDWQRFEETLAEQDRMAKEQVRREMGLRE
jgi:hypothetical protein